jgi:hypothetical protein
MNFGVESPACNKSDEVPFSKTLSQMRWLSWKFSDKRHLLPKQNQYSRDFALDERAAYATLSPASRKNQCEGIKIAEPEQRG